MHIKASILLLVTLGGVIAEPTTVRPGATIVMATTAVPSATTVRPGATIVMPGATTALPGALATTTVLPSALATTTVMPGLATTAKPEHGEILPQVAEVPMSPWSCRWSVWSNGFQSGYRSAWSTIVRAWDSFTPECKRQDDFIQAIRRNEAAQSSQTAKCISLGNQVAISDAARISTEKCGEQCQDIGDVVGQFGASLFCDLQAPIPARSWLKCTKIGVDSCNRAFRNTVSANCPQQLDSWSYSNELYNICTPKDLGKDIVNLQPGQVLPKQEFSTHTFIGLPLFQWPMFKLDGSTPGRPAAFEFGPSDQTTRFPGQTTQQPGFGETTRFPGQTTEQPGFGETTRFPGQTTQQPGMLFGETTNFPGQQQQTTVHPGGPL